MRKLLVVATMVVAGLIAAAPAWAHVTVSPGEASADGYSKLDFSVGHGCDGSPTVEVSIQIPAGVASVTPEVAPGWEITVEEGTLPEPLEVNDETVTEGVTSVTWSGGSLDAHQLQLFGMNVRIAAEAGETLYFPVVQTCEEGENAWIEIPEAGGEEPESPAPALTLVAAGDDGHGGGDATDTTAAGEETVAAGEGDSAAGASSNSDSGSDMVAWAGLALGGLGAILGGAAFASTRRKA
jgi:uncharacterized protein YcnI